MKILTVANQKGGVGKTTLAFHIAHAAREKGKRVLVVDMDIQGNFSLAFDLAKVPLVHEGLLASELFEAKTAEILGDLIPSLGTPKIAIIPADGNLLFVERAGNESLLKNPAMALRKLDGLFDICVIDTPPGLGSVLMAALTASDFVVSPLGIGLFELAGTSDFLATIEKVKTSGLNPNLKHIGMVPMKTTHSPTITRALNDLRDELGSVVMKTELRERVSVRSSMGRGKPVWKSTNGTGQIRAAEEWKTVCSDILKRIK